MDVNSRSSSGDWLWRYFINKYARDGRLLWRTLLPGDGYANPGDLGLSKALTLLADGSAIITGTQVKAGTFYAIIAKIDARGNLLWLSHGDDGNFQPDSFSNAVPGPYGIIVAGGHNTLALFSAKRNVMQGIVTGYTGEVLGFLNREWFLVNQPDGRHLVAYSLTGRQRWSVDTGIPFKFGAVRHYSNRWIAVGTAGMFSRELLFAGVDSRGKLAWQVSVPGYRDDYWSKENHNSVLRADDGTL